MNEEYIKRLIELERMAYEYLGALSQIETEKQQLLVVIEKEMIDDANEKRETEQDREQKP